MEVPLTAYFPHYEDSISLSPVLEEKSERHVSLRLKIGDKTILASSKTSGECWKFMTRKFIKKEYNENDSCKFSQEFSTAREFIARVTIFRNESGC
jgi:hypothetical protein